MYAFYIGIVFNWTEKLLLKVITCLFSYKTMNLKNILSNNQFWGNVNVYILNHLYYILKVTTS